MKNFLKDYAIIILLSLILVVLIVLSLITYNQETVCTYTIDEENYNEEITVYLNYKGMVKTIDNFKSSNEDIIKDKAQEDKDDGYEVQVDGDKITAKKEIKTKQKYYETIKEYKKNGYKCETKFK